MYNNSIWEDIKWQFRYGTDLIKLIMVNITLFVFINLVQLVLFLLQQQGAFVLTDWLSLYASPARLLLQPWGIITYMFVHESFWHILWNMLGLYWFGQIVQDMIGRPKILPLYLLGGIVGGIAYIAAYNIFPVFSQSVAHASCIGASASVMAIVLAAATIAPNYEIGLLFIGPVRIKWIALVYVLLDLINIQNGNAGGHIAHLGGAFAGFAFVRLLQNGTDLSRCFYSISDGIGKIFRKKEKLSVSYVNPGKKKEYASAYSTTQQKKSNQTSPPSDKASKQEQLDAILDKINRSSYESLSKEEKEFLFKISQED